MTVREAVGRLKYKTDFYIRGAHSGRIYFTSYRNKRERLERYLDDFTPDMDVFVADFRTVQENGMKCIRPVIGIMMDDGPAEW